MKRLLTLFFVIFFAFSLKAQFPNSDRIYCYEFVESVSDGVKSYSRSVSMYGYFFIFFHDEGIGVARVWDGKSNLVKNILTDPEFYDKRAIEAYNAPLRDLRSRPLYHQVVQGAQIWRDLYDSELSSLNKTTYQSKFVQARFFLDGQGAPNLMTPTGWGDKWNPGNWCYTFSSDRSELIHWNKTYPGNRDYYRLIDVNSLKPTLDFLK